MEQKTLEQAANEYSVQFWASEIKRNAISDFKAGAEWQKEQFKKLIHLAQQAASICEDEGDFAIAKSISIEIKRLQD
jgi:hypothetical protein